MKCINLFSLFSLFSIFTNSFTIKNIFRPLLFHSFPKENNLNKNRIDYSNKETNLEIKQIQREKQNQSLFNSQSVFDLNWYVIHESKTFSENKLYKKTIWNKDYVVWKTNGKYYAMNDDCSHKGASLSCGKLLNQNVICPYHGYEFNATGKLCLVPGLNFTNYELQNQETYPVIEQNGWVYLNTVSDRDFKNTVNHIFNEPEANNTKFSMIQITKNFKSYARVISENSLDIMHIAFVHSFGNREHPKPVHETPPHLLHDDYPHHYRTEYSYLTGSETIAKKLYGVEKLKIQNEFILPHTTVARVIFDNSVSTVITFATPINSTHSNFFVKTYRNYLNANANDNTHHLLSKLYNYIGDLFTIYTMDKTIEQDRKIVENIKLEHMDGKFNMKFDKLQNTYKTLYKKFIHNPFPLLK